MNLVRRLFRKINIILRRFYYKTCTQNINIGKNLNFRQRFKINVVGGGVVSIGDNVFFNNDCSINAHQSVKIGSDCIFGENVKIYDHNHIFKDNKKPISVQGYKYKPIVIGDNCWVGSNVVILAGSSIGNHVVIGAGSIISGNIENDTIVRSENNYKVGKIIGGQND